MSTDPSQGSSVDEYGRPPLYGRPPGGLVRVLDRLLRQGMTQANALKENEK